jgi:uncharacterized protein YbdZ (MbtH family)
MNYVIDEGDSYYVLENDEFVWSIWDNGSIELHTPETKYYVAGWERKGLYLRETFHQVCLEQINFDIAPSLTDEA